MSPTADEVDSRAVWRTCIGCRERAPQTALVRIVAVRADATTVVTPDPRRSMPGRGAHLHPDPRCLDLARRRKAFGRALRVKGQLDLRLIDDLAGPETGTGTTRT
ncbi:YlxR family protein [Aeromicrobium sp. Leaf350]|uniref:YlxR family protein n=1 Tax=Aeromicrobium sp. Leaf350 TaxID=2876565 RepID=UPI001E29E469|nr:YlxR family protein [Aeromicrobium sp. Leaf350]